MFKIPTYRPKFLRQDKTYPLTKFCAYLKTSTAVGDGAVKNYVAAIRRMLNALGENQPGPDGKVRRQVWLDRGAVEAYIYSLPSRAQHTIKAAQRHWNNFNGAMLPPHQSLVPRTAKASVTAALGALLEYSGCGAGVPPIKLKTITKLKWVYDKNEERWYITYLIGGSERYTFGIGVRVLSDSIRAWGYPDGCPSGAPFIPRFPGADSPMPLTAVREMLDNRVPPAVVKWFDDEMTKDYATATAAGVAHARLSMPESIVAAAKLAVDPTGRIVMDGPTEWDSGEAWGKTKIINGKIVVEHPEEDDLDDVLPD